VLAVAVDLRHDVVAALQRVPEARLHGPADADVERQLHHAGARGGRHGGGLVGRPVVDHEHLPGRRVRVERAYDVAHGGRLVERRDDDEAPVEEAWHHRRR
jgi:hypothetical protein